MAEEPVTPSQAVQIITVLDQSETEEAFVDSLVMQAQQIAGTRYKFNWNNKPSKER